MTETEPTLEVAKQRQAAELQAVVDQFKDERVVVLGGTCTGKSTLIEHLADAKDMDKLVFPLLTKDEKLTTFAKRLGRLKLARQ